VSGQAESQEREEAVCFTSGFQGASFAAGVIHAWLAAARRPPRVVAGISTGALPAAATQRSQRALFRGRKRTPQEREADRWSWFRTYLQALSSSPRSRRIA
jgi:hypothetical protein